MGQNSTKPLLTLSGHTSSLRSTAFSPDGKSIVSASDDSTVRIWDAQSGSSTSKPFKGHAESVNSAVFSPDGTCIASSSRDRTILIWDASKGNILAGPLEGHTDWVWSVAFSPGGTRVASGSKDRTVRIWNAHTGALIGEPLVGHSDAVFSVAFSPDGTRIVSGSRDKTIRIWDAHTGELALGPLEGHLDWVWCVSVSPNGSRIVSGSRDFAIRVWDAQTGNMIAGPFERHYSPVFSVAFSPDGARIISGAQSGAIYIWDTYTGAILLSLFGGSNGAVHSASFSPDGKRIVYGCGDGTAIVQTMIEQHSVQGTVAEAAPTLPGALTVSMASQTSDKNVFDQLVEHGCIDMTSTVDPNSASPVYGGGLGDIWRMRLMDGTEVAVKTWWFKYVSQEDPKELKNAMSDVYNCFKVKHKNIQELLGVVMYQGRLGTVSPWTRYGNLREYLLEHSDENRYALCIQVATGLSHLHKEGMVHGDLKAANILVSEDKVLKLSGFEHSILTESRLAFSNRTHLVEGMLRWMAPELLLSKDPDNESDQPVKRDKRADVYALGMTFLEIITGQPPFAELENDYSIFGALQNKQRPRRPKQLSADNPREGTMWRLLLWCWDHEPTARPRAEDVLMMVSGPWAYGCDIVYILDS